MPHETPQVTPETPEPPPAAPRRPRPAAHALPRETLERIADERTHCEGLSLRAFAQRLYDKRIYATTAKDGRKVPVNQGTLTKWLEQARAAGLL